MWVSYCSRHTLQSSISAQDGASHHIVGGRNSRLFKDFLTILAHRHRWRLPVGLMKKLEKFVPKFTNVRGTASVSCWTVFVRSVYVLCSCGLVKYNLFFIMKALYCRPLKEYYRRPVWIFEHFTLAIPLLAMSFSWGYDRIATLHAIQGGYQYRMHAQENATTQPSDCVFRRGRSGPTNCSKQPGFSNTYFNLGQIRPLHQ